MEINIVDVEVNAKIYRGDRGKVGPLENYAKNSKSVKKNSGKNIDHRQMLIFKNKTRILIRNLDRFKHVKDVTNSCTINT